MTLAATDDLVARWTAAEQAGDADTLDGLIADDFVFAGPLGFVLDKAQWLDRYRGDHLHYTHFAVEDAQMRTYGDVTVVVGVQDQRGDHEGHPVDGRLRLTLIVSSDGGGPSIVGAHLSPIHAPPGTQA